MRHSHGSLMVAKAVFRWAALHRLISIGEHVDLMRSVNDSERALAGCQKITYASFVIASRVAAERRRGRDGHKRCLAYRCRVCGLFHLGDASYERDRRRMKERDRA